jgi:hypothetical protein
MSGNIKYLALSPSLEADNCSAVQEVYFLL